MPSWEALHYLRGAAGVAVERTLWMLPFKALEGLPQAPGSLLLRLNHKGLCDSKEVSLWRRLCSSRWKSVLREHFLQHQHLAAVCPPSGCCGAVVRALLFSWRPGMRLRRRVSVFPPAYAEESRLQRCIRLVSALRDSKARRTAGSRFMVAERVSCYSYVDLH